MSFLRNITSSSASDSELLTRYKESGDIRVLADLYQRYMDLAYAVCLKYFKDAGTAKDAVMDIFEELVVKLPKHEVSNFKSWLYTLVKNHCLMKLRAVSRQKSVLLDENHMQLEEEVHLDGINEKEWHYLQLTKCMEALSGEQKTSIELFYLQEKCYKDISEVTGLEWNRVRSLIQNGRRNLKNCMDKAISIDGQDEVMNIKRERNE